MNPSNQPAIQAMQAINRSTQCILCKLFFAWVALGFYVPLQPSLHAQQVQLRGTVAVHNSQYETGEVIYVQNAYLSAPFTVPATSDVEGVFVLEFVGLDPGTPMKIEAEKAGLEVVNTRELEEVVIGRKFPLRIYVAEKGKLAQAQTELYKISKEALFARRDALIARLRADTEESQAVLEELEDRFGQELKDRFAAEDLLRKKIDEQQKQLPKFAMELAKKNLDNASQLYIQAYELFQQGEIDKVIALLDEEKLQESYAQVKEARARIEEEEALLETRKEQVRRQVLQVIESYSLKADALKLEFRYGEMLEQYGQILTIHQESGLPLKDRAGWHDKRGRTLLDNGTYAPALADYKQALSLRLEVLPHEDILIASSYSGMGLTYESLADYGQALAYHGKARAIREQVLPPEHPELATTYNNIGMVYWRLADYEQALVYYGKARAIQEQVFPPEHPELAGTYSSMGLVYWRLADYEQALTYHGKALAIQEKVLSPEHLSLTFIYNNMGWLYIRLADYAQALEYFGKDRSIREKLLPPKHPSLAVTYNAIGVVYEQLADYEQALAYHGKARAIREQVLPPEHPELATTYNNMGAVYGRLADYEQALVYYGKARAIWEKAFPDGHFLIGLSYSNHGLAYDGLQEYPTAMDYQYKAIAMYRKFLHPEHPRLATAYARLGLVYAHTAQTDSARAYFNQYATIATDTALIHRNQALLALLDGTLPEALTHLEHAVAKGFKNLGWLRREPLLKALHGEARYQALVENLQNKNPY